MMKFIVNSSLQKLYTDKLKGRDDRILMAIQRKYGYFKFENEVDDDFMEKLMNKKTESDKVEVSEEVLNNKVSGLKTSCFS